MRWLLEYYNVTFNTSRKLETGKEIHIWYPPSHVQKAVDGVPPTNNALL